MTLRRLFTRFLGETIAQDLIEYGLLSAFIATVGIFTWVSISNTIGVKYVGWDTGIQSTACLPNPGTTVCDNVAGIH